jgi:hypothetical protein
MTLSPGYCVISVLSDRESKGQTDGQAKNTFTKGKTDKQGNGERERERERNRGMDKQTGKYKDIKRSRDVGSEIRIDTVRKQERKRLTDTKTEMHIWGVQERKKGEKQR